MGQRVRGRKDESGKVWEKEYMGIEEEEHREEYVDVEIESDTSMH